MKNKYLTEIKMKYLNSAEFLKRHVKDEQIRKRIETLLSNPSPITEFKKIPNRNDVLCSLQDGTRHVLPVNNALQLFFDKMEMFPNISVDFGKVKKNKVEILPFQNKIVYIDGTTNKIIKSFPLDASLIFSETDTINPSNTTIDERLNPAVLSILSSNLMDQDSYINGTGRISISYNFKPADNPPTPKSLRKKLSKLMNKYYKSEREYVKSKHLEHNLSEKIGHANFWDKLKNKFRPQKTKSQKYSDENMITFDQAKEELKRTVRAYEESMEPPLPPFPSSAHTQSKYQLKHPATDFER